MDTNSMIKAAWSRYQELHEEAKRVLANQQEYVRLYNWIVATRQMFPDAFDGLSTDPTPLQPPPVLPDIPSADPREFEPLPPGQKTLQETVGSVLTGIQAFSDGLTLSARRSLNEQALELAEKILREKKSLKLEALISEMKLRGWKGYPIEEPITLYNALQSRARKGERFTNLGENTWTLQAAEGGES